MEPVIERPSFFSPQSGNLQPWAVNATQLLASTFQQYGYRLNRVAPLDGSEDFTGPITATSPSDGSTGAYSIMARSIRPSIELYETDVAANTGRWQFLATSGLLIFRALGDDGVTSPFSYMVVTRSGTTVSRIDITAAATVMNGMLQVVSAAMSIRNPGSSASSMTAYISLQDATTERGWIGFGDNTSSASFTNHVGAINIVCTALNYVGGQEFRIYNDSAFVSFINSAGTTRRGYLQANTGSTMILHSEENTRAIDVVSNAGPIRFSYGNAAGANINAQISATAAGQTALSVYDHDNATLERVTVGAADSGGAGFKLLRIPN